MKVDLNSPVDDFHKRVPNMAHEVCVCWHSSCLVHRLPHYNKHKGKGKRAQCL